MLRQMATIRTGGNGHEVTPYLASSRSGSPDSLPSLGCYAHQQPKRRQTLRQQRLRGGQPCRLEQLATGIMAGTATKSCADY